MNSTALTVLLVAALVLYLGVTGKLGNVWLAATTGGTGTPQPREQATRKGTP